MKRGLGLNLYIVYIIYPIFIYAGGNSLYIYTIYSRAYTGGGGKQPLYKRCLNFYTFKSRTKKGCKSTLFISLILISLLQAGFH